jgi:hypothetical protein
MRIGRQCRYVVGDASSGLTTGGLGMDAAHRGRLCFWYQTSGTAMDRIERFFVVLTMLGALSAALSIAWIMLI